MLATLSHAARGDPRPDAELLARFVQQHDQAAFAAVVRRHGPLVLGVCRRALGSTPDADDAFQATFLVLVKRAGGIAWRANLGPWLFGVAHRVAAKARFRRLRRFAVEKQVDAMPHRFAASPDPLEADDLSRAFDDALAELPEDMRRAVVLCELQGLSRAAAAKQLKVSEGTLSSRLGRARKKLAAVLAARGFTLSVPAAVGVSAGLVTNTVQAADPAGVVPAGVSSLVQEALKAMTVSKLKVGAVLLVAVAGCSLVALAADRPKAEPPKGQPVPDVVATVGGSDVTKDEFADYLLKKYGAKEIELFTNRRIIEAEAKKRGVSVSADEVEVAFSKDAEFIAVKRGEFVSVVLPRYGKTEADWKEDVLLPRLLMEKMLGEGVTASDAEVKQAFERKYGEKRRVQMTLWPKAGGEKVARAGYKTAKASADDFDSAARRNSQPALAGSHGMVAPLGRTVDGPSQEVNDAVFELKVGEVSELLDTAQGWVAVRLLEVVPPQADKKFDDEKAALRAEVLNGKVQAGIPKLFAELKADAKPVYHITPEAKTDSVPLPQKK